MMNNDEKNAKTLQLGKWVFPFMLLLDVEDFISDLQLGFIKDYMHLEYIFGFLFTIVCLLNYCFFYFSLKNKYSTLAPKFLFVLLSVLCSNFWNFMMHYELPLALVLKYLSNLAVVIFSIRFGIALIKIQSSNPLSHHKLLTINFLVLCPLLFVLMRVNHLINSEMFSTYVSYISFLFNVTETIILFLFFYKESKLLTDR